MTVAAFDMSRIHVIIIALMYLGFGVGRVSGENLEQELRDAMKAVKEGGEITQLGQTAAPTGTVVVSSDAGNVGVEAQDINILSHVTMKDGITFPPKERVVLEPTPTISYATSETATSSTGDTTRYRRPLACEYNQTKRRVLFADQRETRMLMDILYLSEDLVPIDPEEVFGAGITLYPYGEKSGDAVYTRMQVHDVPCVPYRIRITRAAQYEDYGLNALRNYSKDPAGKGTLDIRIQRKLFGPKGELRR